MVKAKAAPPQPAAVLQPVRTAKARRQSVAAAARASHCAVLCAAMTAKIVAEIAANSAAFYAKADEVAHKAVQPRFLVLGRGSGSSSTASGTGQAGPMWVMDCVACGERKPCAPSHFQLTNGEARFLACPAGRENFMNSASYPCIVCFNRMLQERRRTVPDAWVVHITGNYKRLRAADTAQYGTKPEGWFWERWRIQGGDFVLVDGKHVITKAARCAITNVELCLFGTKFKFSASVNNTNVANVGLANHVSEECELIANELNVAQQHEDIKDLRATFAASVAVSIAAEGAGAEEAEAAVVRAFEANWANSGNAKANGVTAHSTRETNEYNAQRRNLDLYEICSHMASHGKQHDAEKGRDNDMGPKDLYEMIVVTQRCRCAYTQGLVTIENGPMRFSLERIDNEVGHIKSNCIIVSRMLNGAAGMTRAKFLQMRAAWLASRTATRTHSKV